MRYRGFLVALVAVGFTLSARADTVFVKGRAPVVSGGPVKTEDAKGVLVVVKKAEELIPAGDVIDVHYDDLKPSDLRLSGGAYLTAKKAEADADTNADAAKRKASLATAIAKYQETLKKMEPHKYAHRNLEYKVAVLTLRQALTEQTSTAAALTKMQKFKDDYPNSWQINHIVPTLAQMQMDAGDFKGAALTYQEMAVMEVFPADIRRNAELMVVQVTVKAGDFKGAQKKLDDLEKKAAGNPAFASRIKMTRAEVLVGEKKMDLAVPILQQLLKDTKDVQVKAQAHNTLGECLFKANRYPEALWEFLYVDTVYSQDKHERAKALYYLWKTFDQIGSDERSKECRQMLLGDPQFAGTEFQMRALKEAK
jgi:tetratricopeptide (TPR) repeat protein